MKPVAHAMAKTPYCGAGMFNSEPNVGGNSQPSGQPAASTSARPPPFACALQPVELLQASITEEQEQVLVDALVSLAPPIEEGKVRPPAGRGSGGGMWLPLLRLAGDTLFIHQVHVHETFLLIWTDGWASGVGVWLPLLRLAGDTLFIHHLQVHETFLLIWTDGMAQMGWVGVGGGQRSRVSQQLVPSHRHLPLESLTLRVERAAQC
eukprot:350916-Chlamydomonas_euryale.AAC.5